MERTEGKVPNGEQSGGNTINFIFNSLGGQPVIPGSAGEVIQGVLAQQAIASPMPPLRVLAPAPEVDELSPESSQ